MSDFEKIYLEHFENVYRYVFSLCKNHELAEEITQDAFYKAMENIDKFDGRCQLYVWLCQIAKNTYFTFLKKRKKAVPQEEIGFFGQTEQNLENELLDAESAKKLHTLLHSLDEPYKEVFSLRVFGELPFSQIGELFGKTDSWARVIFHRAKKELRRGLDEDSV